MPKPQNKNVGEIVWTAVRTYFVPLGLLGTIIKLWEQLPGPVLIVLVGLLPVYIFWQVGRQVLEKKRREKQIAKDVESIVRLGLAFGRERDNGNRYVMIERSLYVARPDARELIIEHGMNVSEFNHDAAVRSIASDAPVDGSQLDFRASLSVNNGADAECTTSTEELEGGRRLLVTIAFRGMLVRPSNLFRLRWQYSLPGSVRKNEEHWVCGRMGSDLPLGTLRLKAYFVDLPAQISLTGSSEVDVVALTGPHTEVDDSGANWHMYSAEIEHPKADFHLWRWRYM